MVPDAEVNGGILVRPGLIEFVNRHVAECFVFRIALLSACDADKIRDSDLEGTPPLRGGLTKRRSSSGTRRRPMAAGGPP
jgi:hypothetical protein